METKIPLQSFCASGDGFTELCKPINKGGFAYASDAMIMIRVPTSESDSPPIKRDLPIMFARYFRSSNLLPWPSDAPMTRKLLPCPNADDDEFGNLFCIMECPLCHGARRFEQDYNCKVGNHPIAAKYHSLIDILPNARYEGGVKWDRPLPFTFDGGEGLVMGMRDW